MKTCSDYISDAKRIIGMDRMTDRALGLKLGYSQQMIASAKHGNMSDPLALKLAAVIGLPAGELLMVARLEREKNPDVRAALIEWAGNVFSLMPSKAAIELVRGGVRVRAGVRQNQWIMASQPLRTARPIVRVLQSYLAASALIGTPRAPSWAASAR